MSSSKEDSLSPEELRKRLYQTFKNKGVLDTLKAQLRNQLIQELKHPALTGQEPVPRQVPVKSEPLLLSACNSIVADHLHTSGYEYTLSVFYPESGLSKDKILKKDDLLRLLKISTTSHLFTSMANEENNPKGFLFSLVTQLGNSYNHNLHHDMETQTIGSSSYGESLVDKMKMIDKEYERVGFSDNKMFSFQSKLAAYRKEVEAQMEAEMNTKLQHFKEVEIAKVRMEEKSKFHTEFDKLKQELERTYEMKAKALMEREKNAIERLQKQQEIEEKNIYMQRQSVLKEIESLRNREKELKMRMEAFEKTCQIHTEKVKATEELLRRRELAVKTMEDTYDQKLKNELYRYQLELKEEFINRTEKLTESEKRNKEETARIQRESAVIDARLEENNRARSELRRLQIELETAQQQISLLTQQKELLRERLESTGDYLSLKREKEELQGQLQLLRKQLDEAKVENQQLRSEMVKPSKEELALQVELGRLQSARRVEEEEFNNQKQVLQMQLKSEMERCAQLEAQSLECEERSQRMTKHVEDLKMQLRLTQQALENEVLRNPKPSLVDRSVLELSADRLVLPDIYMDRAPLRAAMGHDVVCEAGGPSRGNKSPRSESPDSDMELVADAKARIEEVHKEVERLQEAYRSYQQRAAHSTIPSLLPPQQAYTSHSPSPLRKQNLPRTHIYSAHKPKTLLKPVSLQHVQSPVLLPYEAQQISPPAHSGVTVTDDLNQPHSAVLTDRGHYFLTEFPRDGKIQDGSSVSSYTSQFSARKKLKEESAKEALCTKMTLFGSEEVVFPPLTSDRKLSGAPLSEVGTQGDFSPELSPPRSPQLKSTTREQSSPPKSQHLLSSSESSPQPEKINLEDLEDGQLSEPGHIPELLLDTAVPLSEEAPDDPTAPHPQDLPGDPTDMHGRQADVPQASGNSARIAEEEEDEEQKWKRERKEKQERKQREQEDAKERERQKLEELEKEMLLQEVEQPEREDVREVKGQDEEGKKEGNQMEKYMKIFEVRENQHEQSPVRQEAGQTSPEDRSVLEEEDKSITACSLKDEEEDFW